MKYDEVGHVACTFCKKGIIGEAFIGYSYEDDHPDQEWILHKDCVKPFKLAKRGKVHKCPKCSATGLVKVRVELDVRFSGGYDHIMEPKTCDLCNGDGYLEKEPIPVITDWKKG